MKLPIGTRVKMSEGGKGAYPDYGDNPHNLLGTIFAYFDEDQGAYVDFADYCYTVRWENGRTNQYRHCDLTPLPLVTKELEEYM